jgi:hypothetical protein
MKKIKLIFFIVFGLSMGVVAKDKNVIIEVPLLGHMMGSETDLPVRVVSSKVFLTDETGLIIEPVLLNYGKVGYGTTLGYFWGDRSFFDNWMIGLKGVIYTVEGTFLINDPNKKHGEEKYEKQITGGVFADFTRYYLFEDYFTLRYGGSLGYGMREFSRDNVGKDNETIEYKIGLTYRFHLDLGFAL